MLGTNSRTAPTSDDDGGSGSRMTRPSSPSEPSREPAVDRAAAQAEAEQTLVGQALAKWSAGDFRGCLLDLDEIALARHTSESILLRARALLRLTRAEDARKWLSMMEARHTDEDAMATHSMLLGSAYSQLKQFEEAAALFDSVRIAAPHPTILTETAYYQALSLWQARNFTAARGVLEPAIHSQQDIVTARALQLLGFIAVSEQKYVESHAHFGAALRALKNCRARDKHLEATLLQLLAIGQAEVEVRDPADLDELARQFEWTSDLIVQHVQTLRHIGLAYARTGRPNLALDRLIEAGRVQSQSPWAILGFAEAANLCHRHNEPISAGHYLRLCCRMADELSWDGVVGEARVVLLTLAAAVARSGNGERARQYLNLYFDTRIQLPALSALNVDSRLEVFERHTQAVVGGALGSRDAISLLADVVNDWKRLKYRSRAEEARIDLHQLTRRSYNRAATVRGETEAEPDVLQSVATGASTTPSRGGSSNHGVQLSVSSEHDGGPKAITVTAQQDRIIRQLISGRTIAEIAENLTLEKKTVRNHLARVYAQFEVSGQSQLIAAILRDPRLRQSFLALLAVLFIS